MRTRIHTTDPDSGPICPDSDSPESSLIPENSSPSKNLLILEGEEFKALPHSEKLALMKRKAPKLTREFTFWPIFDTKTLCRTSFVFFYYFELYLFQLKLLIIVALLTGIYYGISYLLTVTDSQLGDYWLFLIYGLVTIVIIRAYSMVEDRRILKQRSQQTEDWTQNKFSLLVENLPKDATKQEIKAFFEEKIRENGLDDKIREIMLLQDCSRYMNVEKELRNKNYKTKKSMGRQSLIDDVTRLQHDLIYLINSAQDFELYKGTAIVIFETVRGKITIENCFKLKMKHRLLYKLMPGWIGKQYRFQGEVLRVKEAPEPSDLNFEKIHIPKSKRLWRKILTYLLGNLALIILGGIVVMVRLGYTDKPLKAAEAFSLPFYLYSGVIIVTTAVIYLFTDYMVERIIINRTKSACELNKIKFRLNISYLTINAYLVVLMHFEPDFKAFEEQVLLTTLILIILIPLRKIFSIISFKKLWLRRKLRKDPHCLEKYTPQELIEAFTKPQFDFANGIEDSVCFMFIALGFYFINHVYIAVITLMGLIICICVDKITIVYFMSPPKIKGSEMGLEFFRILTWDIRLQLLTIAFLPDSAYSSPIPIPLKIVLFVFYGIFLVWDFRDNVRKRWRKKWSKERENTKYAEVKQCFHHIYQQEYPFKVY